MITKFLIGTDYEYFVKNEEGQVASAIGYIGGTKKRPLSIGNNCFRQSDNILAEFNQPPVDNLKEWLDYFKYTHEKGSEVLAEHGLQLYTSTSEYIDPQFLRNPAARHFGCEISYCAYPNRPEADMNPTNLLRTAGLHVHIGFKEEDEDLERLMRIMDYNLGVPSVIIDPDKVRRQRYGVAGEFRFTKRGDWNVVEYRSLGAYFLSSEELLTFVWEQTIKSVADYNNGFNPSMDISYIINEYIEDEAWAVMDEATSEKVEQIINNVKTGINV